MKKLNYLLLRLRCIFQPLRITLDGTDNTITINSRLLQILRTLGIEDRNHIFIYHLLHTSRYAFQILPDDIDPKTTISTSLLYNTHFDSYGFEAQCPTIQAMLYSWNLAHSRIIHTTATPHLSPTGTIYFVINYPR